MVVLYDNCGLEIGKQQYPVCYRSYDGQGSLVAGIEHQGLQGRWYVRDMSMPALAEYRADFCYKTTPLQSGHPTRIELNPHLDPNTDAYEQPDTASACDLLEALIVAGIGVRVVKTA